MSHRKRFKHQHHVSTKSWMMISGLVGLVGLLLLVAKLHTPQDIRQKASGSECYLAIKDAEAQSVEIVEGTGGQQQIGGTTYCVGGIGNDADRYVSFYSSRIAGQTAIKQSPTLCQSNTNPVGSRCEVEGKVGRVICVAGPAEEYFGCIGEIDGQKFYHRLTSRQLAQSTISPITPSPTKSLGEIASWQDVPVTIKVGFVPHPATDPTKPAKNHWPWLVLLLNNGAGYRGAYDRTPCTVEAGKKVESGCGQPNLYREKWLDNFEIATEGSSPLVIKQWRVSAGELLASQSPTLGTAKLSFVYYNDYWDGDKANRSVEIKFVQFLLPDGQEIKSFQPQDRSFYHGHKLDWSAKQSFYFDLGAVSDQNEVDANQDGLVQAFDKLQLEDIDTNQSSSRRRWLLDREGSFNLVATGLARPVQLFFQELKRK